MNDAQRLREVEQALQDAVPTFTCCAFCPDWSYSGTAADGREAALRHRLESHPEIIPSRRRPTNHLVRFRQPVLDPEERALIEYERQRRARMHGVKLQG